MFGFAAIVYAYQQRRFASLVNSGVPKLLAYGLVMTEWTR